MVATDEHLQATKQTVSRAVRPVGVAIVRRLPYKHQRKYFLRTTAAKAKVEEEFLHLRDLQAVVGSVDGTFAPLKRPYKSEHVYKATYKCWRGQHSRKVLC